MKFPKSVEPHPSQTFVADKALFAWHVDAPRTLASRLGPLLLVLAVLAATLFPIAPYKVKLGVVHTSMALLAVILLLSVVRLALFASVWLLLGRYVWLLPNLYSEEVPLLQLLTPWVAETKVEKAPPLVSRAFFALLASVATGFIYNNLPEGAGGSAGIVGIAKGTEQSILEMLNLHNGGLGRLGDVNASSAAGLVVSSPGGGAGLGIGSGPLRSSAASAAAAAVLARGAAGPAGVEAEAEALSPEKIASLAPSALC